MRKPSDEVKMLIENGRITYAQGMLFYLADEACERLSDPLDLVELYVGTHAFGVSSVGLDVSLPGIIIAQTLDGRTVYIDWAELAAVRSTA